VTLQEYVAFKETEHFLDSLLFAKPTPHFVAPKHADEPPPPFGIERLARFLQAAGNPHRTQKFLHITGTSGKTSTTYFLACLLETQGLTTGMFTSPPLCSLAEYFTINRQWPPVADIIQLVREFTPLLEREYAQQGASLSQFEFLCALALIYFARRPVDYTVLEVGLGGRHDATNVIECAAVSIITNIGLDHTHLLGKTLPAIAQAKLGILKAGTPVLTAERRPELLTLFRQEAAQIGASVQALGVDFHVKNIAAGRDGTVFDYTSGQHCYRGLRTTMRGAYQAENAALALRALELVAAQSGQPIKTDDVRRGLQAAVIPGRCEFMPHDPRVILDGAHNPEKIRQFAAYLKTQFTPEQVIFVCAFTSGKEPAEMLAPLLEISRAFYLTKTLNSTRADEEPLYLKTVLNTLRPDVHAAIYLNPADALDAALDAARARQQVVCVTGSLYLVALLRQRWYPEYALL